jgi:hypothetical protein
VAIPTKSLDDIDRRQTAHFRTSFPGFPLGLKKFLGRASRAVSLALWGLQKAIEDIDIDIVPSSKSSTENLASWAELSGLPNGAGGYGPLVASTSSGGAATLTGTLGTVYPDGAVATAEDGSTEVALSGSVTIPGSPPGLGSIGGQFIATTTGPDGNLPIGTVLTWQSPPSGADPTFTLTSPMTNGTSGESNPDVFARFRDRLQTPPRGGVAEDYRLWAQVAGVVGVYVFPKRSGTGSVDLVLTAGGSGQARAISSSIQTAAQDAVDLKRPITVDFADVIIPYMPNGVGHLVRLRVAPYQSKYNFDWDDTAASYTVDTGGYSGGPPATLRLNTLAPASLKAAITAFIAGAGPMPRLQVLSTGSVVNPAIGCVAYSDGGGKTTLTLDDVPATWTSPANGNTVYAYGPVVASIANGVLALADSLGPSRFSGFGDPLTPWQDTLTISGISRIAEDALDTDGTKFVSRVLTGGATIDGATADVQGSDTGQNGPEILYLLHVAVTQ